MLFRFNSFFEICGFHRIARHFFEEYIPFWKMEPADKLTSDNSSFCFAEKDNVYVVYLPMGLQTTEINIGNSGKEFSVHWFNPRESSELFEGSVKKVKANGTVKLGFPPKNKGKDWVVLIN